jgi:hypothetical protein
VVELKTEVTFSLKGQTTNREGSKREDILYSPWIKCQRDLKYKLAHYIKKLIKSISLML